MRCVKLEENIFILEVVVGLLLFEVFRCVMDDLCEFVGRKMAQRLVLEDGAHLWSLWELK